MIQSWRGVRPRIHPTAFVHPMATVIGDVELAEHVSVWPGVVLRGDCGPIRIGPYTNLQDGTVAHTTGGVSEVVLGARVTVGHSVVLHGCRIGDDCLIGMHSTLLDNCVLADRTMVAAGTLIPVGRSYPENSLLIGSPARAARTLEAAHLAQIDHGWRSYVAFAQPFLNGEVETLG
jgi:carbonic anhydrase/acetyltransferase-like protein (isoleucine patch superfamily)